MGLFDLCQVNAEARTRLVTSIVKECAWGDVLFLLMKCNENERADTVRLFQAIADMDDLSSIKVEGNPLKEVAITLGVKSDSGADDREVDIQGLLSSPPVDRDGRVLRPPSETFDKFFNRYDLDRSGTLNCSNELSQLTMNLIFNLGLKFTVEEVQHAINRAGDMRELMWDIEDFKKWFFSTFEFSQEAQLCELEAGLKQLDRMIDELKCEELSSNNGELRHLESQRSALKELRSDARNHQCSSTDVHE